MESFTNLNCKWDIVHMSSRSYYERSGVSDSAYTQWDQYLGIEWAVNDETWQSNTDQGRFMFSNVSFSV